MRMNETNGTVDEEIEENKCRYCAKKYKSSKNLKNHEEMHIYEFSCTLCNKPFRTLQQMEKHEKAKHKEKVKKCKKCPKVFAAEDALSFHINEEHKGNYDNYFMCSDCGRQFKTKSELSNHINSKCGTIKLFKCRVCSQELMTAGSLHNHMLRHKGEPNFMCGFCAKLFLTAGQLKVHERIHTQDKAFVCNVCGKGFCHRQSLITHSTLHTGIKPYLCENCGNSFSCVGNLLKHRKTHADCGLTPLTTHRVKNPTTKMKVKVNTPENSRLKHMKKVRELEVKLTAVKKENIEQNDSITHDFKIYIKPERELLKINEGTISPNEKNNFIDYKTSSDLCLSQVNIHINENTTAKEETLKLNEAANVSDDLCGINFDGNYSDPDDSKDLMQPTSNYALEGFHEAVDETENMLGEGDSNYKKSMNRNKSSKITNHEQFIKRRGIKNKGDICCKHCNKSYSNPRWLLKHEKLYHSKNERKMSEDVNVYKCSCCKMKFNNKDECKSHQNKEHADVLTCQDCEKIFSNMDSIRTHEKIFHKGIRRKIYTYMCNRCGKQYKQKSSLVVHEQNKCESGPSVRCDICGKQFSSLHVRNSHMRIHDTEKKLLCKFCGKSFHWKGQLKIHERSHTGEKPYTCLYCPKAFAYRESLITHSSLHTGIKPHLCEACGSRFSCVGNLIKHKSTHANTCGVWYSKNKNSSY